MVSAVVFAGGVGARMKSQDVPKQFLIVDGKPIIIRTLEVFSNHPEVDEIAPIMDKIIQFDKLIKEINSEGE